MKTTSQIKVDRWVWKPLARIINAFAKRSAVGATPGDIRCVVVCKFKGLGNLVQATPMLHSLKEGFPGARIVFLTTATNKALLDLLPLVDDTIYVDESSWWALWKSLLAARRKIRSMRPDAFLNLEVYSFFSAVFTWWSHATLRLGFSLNDEQPSRGLYTHQAFYDPDVPLSTRYHSLVRFLGLKESQEGSLFKFDNLAYHFGAESSHPLLVINPNVSQGGLVRRWPGNRFSQLALRWLEVNPEGRVVVTGSASERDYVLEIVAATGDSRVTDFAGQQGLPALLQLLAQATVFVTNDSGPMHLAFAMRVPTVALFGPTGPWKYRLPDNSRGIYQPVPCSPCLHRGLLPACDGNNICMQAIGVEEVLSAVRELRNSSAGA